MILVINEPTFFLTTTSTTKVDVITLKHVSMHKKQSELNYKQRVMIMQHVERFLPTVAAAATWTCLVLVVRISRKKRRSGPPP